MTEQDALDILTMISLVHRKLDQAYRAESQRFGADAPKSQRLGADASFTGSARMIRSLQLENFKAFGQRSLIPLAPITLIYGENSSGKSSILQSLNLLKQTRESRDIEALLLPRTESGFVDLGSFQELLFDHRLDKTLSIRIDLAMTGNDREAGIAPRFLRSSGTVGLEFAFARKKAEDEIAIEGFRLCGEDSSRPVATFEKCELPRDDPTPCATAIPDRTSPWANSSSCGTMCSGHRRSPILASRVRVELADQGTTFADASRVQGSVPLESHCAGAA